MIPLPDSRFLTPGTNIRARFTVPSFFNRRFAIIPLISRSPEDVAARLDANIEKTWSAFPVGDPEVDGRTILIDVRIRINRGTTVRGLRDQLDDVDEFANLDSVFEVTSDQIGSGVQQSRERRAEAAEIETERKADTIGGRLLRGLQLARGFVPLVIVLGTGVFFFPQIAAVFTGSRFARRLRSKRK